MVWNSYLNEVALIKPLLSDKLLNISSKKGFKVLIDEAYVYPMSVFPSPPLSDLVQKKKNGVANIYLKENLV